MTNRNETYTTGRKTVIFFVAYRRSDITPVTTSSSETLNMPAMSAQPKKTTCVLEFHSTGSVTLVQEVFWRKFHKNPPCTN
jgi:hypothetical protein